MTRVVTTSAVAPPKPWQDGWRLALLLAAAAVLRGVAWRQTAVIFNDGPVFLGMAEAILEGRWDEIFAHPYHPLYPALVALVSLASIELESAAVAVSIAGGLLSIVAIFLFVRRAFDRELAWLAAWTVALHPWAVDFSSDVMSDGLYGGFYLMGFAALAALVDRPRLPLALACGAAAGLAYLVRPEGVGLLVSAVVLFGVRAIDRPESRGRSLACGLAVGIAAMAVMAPLLLSVAEQTGEIALTQKKSLLELATGEARVERPTTAPRAPQIVEQRSRSGEARRIPLPISSERADGGGAVTPPRTLLGVLEAISRAGRTSLAALRYEIALMVLIGLWSIRSRLQRLREWTVAVPTALYMSVLVLLVWGAGYVARRHALAALLPLVGYAVVGWRALHFAFIDSLVARGLASAAGLKSPRFVCFGLALLLCVVWGPRDLRARRDERVAVRAAAEWLADRGGAGSRVAAQKLRVAYYARADYVPLPSGNFGSIEAILRAQDVDWVVIDADRFDDHSGLAEGAGSWLRTVHSVERSGHLALVLEMLPKPAI